MSLLRLFRDAASPRSGSIRHEAGGDILHRMMDYIHMWKLLIDSALGIDNVSWLNAMAEFPCS